LAFATVLGDGVKPEECQFVERNIRQTLYRAFQNKKAPYLLTKKSQQNLKGKQFKWRFTASAGPHTTTR